MAQGLALWRVVLGLSPGPAVRYELARFACGLIMPAMRADPEWSLAQAGGLNTLDAMGCLLGALATLGCVCIQGIPMRGEF